MDQTMRVLLFKTNRVETPAMIRDVQTAMSKGVAALPPA